MQLSVDARRNTLATVTGFVVFAMIFPGHHPWEKMGWGYLIVTSFLFGFVLQILSLIVCSGYGALRKRMLPSMDSTAQSRQELAKDEVFIVFCVTLLVVSAVILLADVGVFDGIDGRDSTDSPLR